MTIPLTVCNPFLDETIRTQRSFIASKLLSSPLFAFYSLLPFILCKDLKASPLLITLLISSRPATSLLSLYGTTFVQGRAHRLKGFIACTTVLGLLPCLFFPWMEDPSFFALSYILFMVASRSSVPAWSELLRLNVSSSHRSRIFSQGSTIQYLSGLLIPLGAAPWLDCYPHEWKIIFAGLAILKILSLPFIWLLPGSSADPVSLPPPSPASLSTLLVQPWRSAWHLLCTISSFRQFQLVFMLGGSGLMLMQPVFPLFFTETLHLSYLQLSLAITLCKAVGFALTSPLWATLFPRLSLSLFDAYVTLCASVFAFVLMASSYSIPLLYCAYLLYGMMQAGSELSWHLSGPLFSRDRDSTPFTSVNMACVGLRGCIIPLLGECLFSYTSAFTVFCVGGLLCLTASLYSLTCYHTQPAAVE